MVVRGGFELDGGARWLRRVGAEGDEARARCLSNGEVRREAALERPARVRGPLVAGRARRVTNGSTGPARIGSRREERLEPPRVPIDRWKMGLASAASPPTP